MQHLQQWAWHLISNIPNNVHGQFQNWVCSLVHSRIGTKFRNSNFKQFKNSNFKQLKWQLNWKKFLICSQSQMKSSYLLTITSSSSDLHRWSVLLIIKISNGAFSFTVPVLHNSLKYICTDLGDNSWSWWRFALHLVTLTLTPHNTNT